MKEGCQHENICIVTQTPVGEGHFQTPKTFIECSDCGEILPIKTVTQRNENIPIVKEINSIHYE